MAITYQNLKVQGILKVSRIKGFSMILRPGEHGKAVLTAELEDSIDFMEMTSNQAGQKITILGSNEEGKQITLFSGVIKTWEYKCFSHHMEIKTELVTGSFLLDQRKKNRSFQDGNMTYKNIVESILSERKDGDAIFSCGEDKIERPLIQYNETDWEFIKRLASHYQTSIIPEVTLGEPKFFFGMERTYKSNTIIQTDYKVGVDEKYFQLGGKESRFMKNDFMYYEISSSENYAIGEEVIFNGKQTFICSKVGELMKGELLFCYQLATIDFISVKKSYNSIFSGATLKGTVLETKKEFVKIHLDMDAEQEKGTAYYFPWTPSTGNLFYCMPQVGTKVALYIRSEDEQTARGVHCIRTNGDSNGNMKEVYKKYFTTEHGKRMELFPESIGFHGTSETAPLFIQTEDGQGVQIESNQVFQMIAKDEIRIQGEFLKINAPKQVTLMKSSNRSTTVFNICNEFDVKGKIGGLSGADTMRYVALEDNSTQNKTTGALSMGDPVLIGGKSNAPGPKILKKSKQTELIPSDLMSKESCLYEEYLLEGVKEKVESLHFHI